jgi:hypothetical protein
LKRITVEIQKSANTTMILANALSMAKEEFS